MIDATKQLVLSRFRIHKLSRDMGLGLLLLIQVITLFVVIPFGVYVPFEYPLINVCHILYAVVSAFTLSRKKWVRLTIFSVLAVIILLPFGRWGLAAKTMMEIISVIAFVFNVFITILVTRRVFTSGRVTSHRIQGAILLYLNVASLFSILYLIASLHIQNAFSGIFDDGLSFNPEKKIADIVYFSMTTITTTGYGDITPLNPIVKSLANMESLFGQLYPATLVARLVGLHIAHEEDERKARKNRVSA